MRNCFCFVCVVILTLAIIPVTSHANARLISVVPVSGGCVSGPTGPAVQSWDIEPGETYTVTIADVVECGNGGTDPTINVRVNNEYGGNVDLVATYVSDGVYEFDYTMAVDAICTFPIFYCTTPGDATSGILVIRDDGVMFQAHLRAALFGPGCTAPAEICEPVPTRKETWGSIKALFE